MSDAKLQALVTVFEIATTDGELHLDTDQIGDVYASLQWIQTVRQNAKDQLREAQQQDDAPKFNEMTHMLKELGVTE